MTGRIHYTPEARQHLDELDDWIAGVASADVAQRFVSAVMAHIDGILVFPVAGTARDDVRPGVRTTVYKAKTLIAYEVDEAGGEIVVTVLGVFHGGQDWTTSIKDAPARPVDE